jgi:hypothetical protein
VERLRRAFVGQPGSGVAELVKDRYEDVEHACADDGDRAKADAAVRASRPSWIVDSQD